MNVIEVKKFLYHAKYYEGQHSVTRWDIGQANKFSRSEYNILRTYLNGRRLRRQLDTIKPNIIICQNFGNAYGLGKGGNFVKLRHLSKGIYEKLLVKEVCKLKEKSGVPMAVIDISDDVSINPINRNLLEVADVYFKRELPLDPYLAFESFRSSRHRPASIVERASSDWSCWVKKLKPFALGCAKLEPDESFYKTWEKKKWDVFYAGDDKYKPRRKGVIDSILGLRKLGITVNIPENPLDIKDYLEAMASAKFTLSPPGLGWDCHRTYEAAMVGTIPIMPFPTIRRYKPLLDGEHCYFYDPEKDLSSQLSDIIKNHSNEHFARKGFEHSMKYHTHKSLYQYVIDTTLSKAK